MEASQSLEMLPVLETLSFSKVPSHILQEQTQSPATLGAGSGLSIPTSMLPGLLYKDYTVASLDSGGAQGSLGAHTASPDTGPSSRWEPFVQELGCMRS